jgi:hypothetical protein
VWFQNSTMIDDYRELPYCDCSAGFDDDGGTCVAGTICRPRTTCKSTGKCCSDPHGQGFDSCCEHNDECCFNSARHSKVRQ